MKKMIIWLGAALIAVLLAVGCSPKHNVLTSKEKADGWQLLFDGRTLDGWRDFNGDSLTGPWTVVDGAIQAMGEGSDASGYIVTDKEYSNFHHLCMDVEDNGALYHGRNPAQRGSVIRYNYFHDIQVPFNVRATYHDDGSGAVEVYGNIFDNISSPPVQIGGGSDVVYHDNIFMNLDCAAIKTDGRLQTWGADRLIAHRDSVALVDGPAFREHYPDVEVLMGTSTAGIAHAAIVGHIMRLPMGYVRGSAKDHGKGNQIEGKLEEGQKVVVVEDLISTGGSVIEVVEALRAHKAQVLGVVSIFTYGMQKGLDRLAEANVTNYSLTNFDEIVKAAAEEGYIKQEDIDRLIAFRNNPSDESWIGTATK